VNARGGPEAPMGLNEVEAKFRVMAADLGEPRLSALWSMRDRLLLPETSFQELACLVRAPLEPGHD
jgi:hypothetical protein